MRYDDIANDPNLISGIHNYCDRWCERCQFASRCAVYKLEQADPDPVEHDLNNAAFWQKLSSIFKETHQMITEWADENGVDLSEEALKPIGDEDEKRFEASRDHPLVKMAHSYAMRVHRWLEELGEEPLDEELRSYVEVISWYEFFIEAKLNRAVLSQRDDADFEDPEPDGFSDADGSAKIALIAITRSMHAWQAVGDLEKSPEEALELAAQLEILRRAANKAFPLANDFIRPGFDEPTLDLLH